MPVVYLKRHRMQIDLRQVNLDLPDSPNVHSDPKKEYRGQNALGEIEFLPWGDNLITLHSLAKWESFRFEIDASVFPCLGDREGCKQLMRDLSQRANFVPEAFGIEWPPDPITVTKGDSLSGAISPKLDAWTFLSNVQYRANTGHVWRQVGPSSVGWIVAKAHNSALALAARPTQLTPSSIARKCSSWLTENLQR